MMYIIQKQMIHNTESAHIPEYREEVWPDRWEQCPLHQRLENIPYFSLFVLQVVGGQHTLNEGT